jgi:ADP-ribose pyrophosphatase YjhB (NUDIX family)
MSSPDPSSDPEQAPAADPAPKRRRRRRSRRGRKPAAKVENGTGPEESQPRNAEETGTDEAAAKPKKRRRRGRRSRSGATGAPAGPTDSAAAPPAPVAPAEPSPAGPGTGRRKKRRRRGSGSGSGTGEEQPALIRGRRRTRSGRIEEVSAGGLVVDATGDVVRGVLIGKHDRKGRLVWSLPKGHVETGETLEQTAVREIEEETGVTAEVRHKLGEVDYWFMLHGEKIHKTVHHFLLRFVSGELCDRDVEVAEVAWVPLAEIPAKLAYPDERRLVAQVPELLPRAM